MELTLTLALLVTGVVIGMVLASAFWGGVYESINNVIERAADEKIAANRMLYEATELALRRRIDEIS